MFKVLFDGAESDLKFSQDDVNRFNKQARLEKEAADKKAELLEKQLVEMQAKIKSNEELNKTLSMEKATLLDRVEELGKTAQLTEQQRKQHEDDLKAERNKGLSEAERLKKELQDYTTKLGSLDSLYKQEKESYETQIRNITINNEILAHAAIKDHEAHNPADLIPILGPKAKIVEGKVLVSVNDKELPVSDALKQMKSSTTHGYLFKPETAAGVGGQGNGNAQTNNGLRDPKDVPTAEWANSPERKAQMEKK